MALRFLSPIHKSTRQIGLYLEGRMTELGVSNAEGHLLMYLESYAPSPVGELRRVFGLKGSTLTGMLDRLEQRGLLVRQLHPQDRRSFLVDLTSEGRQLAAKVRETVERLEDDIGRQLKRGDPEGFRAVMDAIANVTRVELCEPKETT